MNVLPLPILSVTVSPEPSLVPPVTGEVPRCAGGTSPLTQVPPNFVEKKFRNTLSHCWLKRCRRCLEKRGMENNHWGWLFIAVGLIGLGVAIAMVVKMPA